MNGFFVDVTDYLDNKLGAGPISTATSWRHTRRLDRAGVVGFDVPATDERTTLLQNRRYVRCKSQPVGDVTEFGHGIIDKVVIDTNDRMLAVSGDDIVRELAWRPIGFQPLLSGTDPIPLTDALDTVISVNNSQADPDWTVDYTTYRSTGDTSNGSTTISNVTNISNWTGREGSPIYGAGIPAGATVTAVGASSLTISAAATATATGVVIYRSVVYYQCGDESVLQILVKLAELTGTHWRLHPTTSRCIQWLYNVQPSSGVRAVTDVDPIAAEGNADICIITDLTIEQDSYDVISHITPWGSGNSTARLKLADSAADANRTTRTAPAGYTLDLDNNVIRRDAAETDYGYNNRYIQFNDVSVEVDPSDASYAAALVTARNQLCDLALEYLRTHSYLLESYRLSVTKLDRAVYPGETIHVIYRGVGMITNSYTGEVSTQRWIDVDADLLVLETTTEFSENGVRTPGLVVATIDRWPTDDIKRLVEMTRQHQQAQTHTQPAVRAQSAEAATTIPDGSVTPEKLSTAVYVLDRDLTAATVANSVAETSVYSAIVPGGTLGTTRALRVRVFGTILNNTGATATLRLRVKYGGTTVFDVTTGAIAANASARGIRGECHLLAAGATNVQVADGWFLLSAPNATAGATTGGATAQQATHPSVAVDSTTAQTLEITAQLSAASANLTTTILAVVVEAVK